VAQERKEQTEQAMTALQRLAVGELSDKRRLLSDKTRHGCITPADATTLEVARVFCTFPGYYPNLNLQQFEWARTHPSALTKLNQIESETAIQAGAWNVARGAPIPEVASVPSTWFAALKKAGTQLGLESPFDTETAIPAERFAQNTDRVIELCDQAAQHDNRSIRSRAGKPTGRCINAFKRELKAAGHRLVRRTQRIGKGKKRVVYKVEPHSMLQKLLAHYHPGGCTSPGDLIFPRVPPIEPPLKKKRKKQ
jgi:hypothetical protein